MLYEWQPFDKRFTRCLISMFVETFGEPHLRLEIRTIDGHVFRLLLIQLMGGQAIHLGYTYASQYGSLLKPLYVFMFSVIPHS